MADRKVEKYLRILKRKDRMWDLIRTQMEKNANDFAFVVHNVLHGCIPFTESGDEYVPEEDAAAQEAVRKLMNTAEYNDMFNQAMRSEITRLYPNAINRMAQQVNDTGNPWLANKAANDIATRYDKLLQGDAGNVVTIKFEGMPEIGVPDGEGE